MIKITLTSSDARNLSEIADSLSQGLEDVLLAVGTEMTGYVMEDFEAKSRGGSGADGTQWKPLDPKTIKRKAKRAKGGNTQTQIGVDTGLMRASAMPGLASQAAENAAPIEIQGNEVTVGFRRRYSKYFDKSRTLIPDPIPQEWVDAAEEIVEQWVTDLWNQRIKP